MAIARQLQIRYVDGTSTVSPIRARALRPVPDAGDAIPTSALLAALSTALDLTEGQLAGHALRTAYLATRLADALGLDEAMRNDLYFAAFLKDAGCSSNAAALTRLFGGDDIDLKRRRATLEATPAAYAAFTIRALSDVPEPLPARVRRLVAIAVGGARARRDLEQLRCERGASIARKAGFGDGAADMIGALREHWDGGGEPRGLARTAIPVGARILALCEGFDAFRAVRGAAVALRVVGGRRGTWYDPALVDALVDACGRGLVDDLEAPGIADRTLALEPARVVRMSTTDDVDRIAGAFADVVDAKSPFTGTHSRRVASIGEAMAEELGLPDAVRRDVRRAGLLHDIGKLGVPNRILDKPGSLDATEFDLIRRHPELTLRILEPVPTFAGVAHIAACHHERLDGRGYFRQLGAEALSIGARIVAVADVFEALTADRPYRPAMDLEQALGVIDASTGEHLATEAVAALRLVLARGPAGGG
jgi:putative nucleotidyltransferase with HDIG domain